MSISPARARRCLVAVLSILVLTVLGQIRFTIALGQAVATASPEEEALNLVPYRLSPLDVPAGYRAGSPSTSTITGTALNRTVTSGNPHTTLASLRGQGYIVWMSQTLTPVASSDLPTVVVSAYVMSSAATARNRTDGRLDGPLSSASAAVDPVTLDTMYGDASSAWHIVSTAADGTSTGFYEVRWQRGRLTFEIFSRSPYGAEKLSDVLAITAITAKKGVEATISDPAAPAFTPVATEDERIDAALKLRTAEIAPQGAPDGFYFAFSTVTTTAGSVLITSDPAGALRYLNRQLRRVIGVAEVFQAEPGINSPFLELDVVLDGSPQAALADLARQHSSGSAGDGIDPPASVGDAIVAFRSSTTASDGSSADRVDVVWTHGPVIIEIFMRASSDLLTDDYVAAFIQQAEAAYQASALSGGS